MAHERRDGSATTVALSLLRATVNVVVFFSTVAVAFSVPYPLSWLRGLDELLGVPVLLWVWFVPAGAVTAIWCNRTREPSRDAFLLVLLLVIIHWAVADPAHGGDPDIAWRSLWPAL